MKGTKKVVSLLLIVVLTLSMIPMGFISALAYDANAAVAYAYNHWDDGVGLCAQFVSSCLNAGGCSCYNVSTSYLFWALEESGLGQVYQLYRDPNSYYISYSANKDILSLGDPIFYYSAYETDGRPFEYTALFTSIDYDNDRVLIAQHNSAQIDYPYHCKKSNGMEITATYVFHFNQPNTLTIYYDCYGSSPTIDTSKGYYLSDYNRICTTTDKHQTAWDTENVYYETVKYGETLGTYGLHDFATFGLAAPAGYHFAGWRSGDNGALLDETTRYTATDLTDEILEGDCDVWMTAQFAPNTYTVYFDANGGYNDGITSKTVVNGMYYGMEYEDWISGSGEYDLELPCPERDGYDFIGWYTSPSGGTLVDWFTIVETTSDQTLFAHWIRSAHLVTLYSNGGYFYSDYSFPDTKYRYARYGWTYDKDVEYGDEYTVSPLPVPYRPFYTFDGWFTAPIGGTKVTDESIVTVDSDHTLYAHWTANTYTVIFNGNGATSGSMSNQTFTYDVAQNLTANAFQRKYTVAYNYNGATGGNSASTAIATATFNGWATTARGAKVYDNKQCVKNLVATGTIDLYANWTPGTVILPTPTKTGYVFGGWYTDSALTTSAGTAGASYTPTANVALYAKWTTNPYIVKFNGNGSTSGSMSDQTFTYDVAQNLTANAFQRKYTVTYNYNGATGGNTASVATATATFNGWATSASGSKVYDDKQSVKNLATSGTYNLYANWTLKTVALPTPTKTGYSFGGWYTDSALTTFAGAAGASYKPTASVMLYAKWTNNTYTVKFNGNGATGGNMPSSSHSYDVTQTLSGNAFYREYSITLTYNMYEEWDTYEDTLVYLFDGWNTQPDGSGDAYVNRQSVINLTTDEEFLLYAQWHPTQYVLPTPERDGYTFGGWYSTPNFTPVSFVGGGGALFTTEHNIDLYAKWEKNAILGDADRDGEIDLKDVVQIARYLAGGWNVTVDMSAADVNKDGVIDLKDAVLLRRYLAGGWDVQLA